MHPPHCSRAFLLALGLFLSVASSFPVSPRGRSFKVLVRRNDSNLSSPLPAGSGVAAMGKAYRKFGFPSAESPSSQSYPRRLRRSGEEIDAGPGAAPSSQNSNTSTIAGKTTADVIATAEEGDAQFLSPVTIGGQTVRMNFDTGSSDLWVFNSQLPDSAEIGHRLYDPTKSTTFKPLSGATFKISYGDSSSATGNVGTDTVNIGGAVVTNQAVELATDVSESFSQDVKSDGLLGLGFSSINTVKPQKQKTFFDNIMPTLEQPLFTANLRHATVGSYEFGRIDASQFQGPLSFTPIDNSRGFWEFGSKSFAVGDGEVQTNDEASPAIADTGTSLMLVDDTVVQAYWSKVEGANLDKKLQAVVFPCDSQLPDFHVAIGLNYMATIPGPLMSFSHAQGLPGFCFGGLQSNRGQKIQIYGAILFKSHFVVFHGGNLAIGVARHAN